MKLDAVYLMTFFSVFTRLGTILMIAPVVGRSVPVPIKAFLSAVIAFALAPMVAPYMPAVATNMAEMVAGIGRDVLFGLLIGGCMQLIQSTFQITGTLMDFQLGVSSAQAFNPMIDSVASPLTQFKSMLATVILLLLDGHHLIFRAFIDSYHVPVGSIHMDATMLGQILSLLCRLMLLAVQIAAPVGGVSIIVDVAAGIINKAVPQTQPFLIAMPAKLTFGVLALAFGLPSLVIGVDRSLGFAFGTIHSILGMR